ncbi:uncharacterized protein LOC116204471 [Punica granatum]|uniref:Uncharacterized protein LOC116204471 n=2 Tax=Punica granatum TaxID=22663 RepID=A0A6P8D751_PUNGR|nr:uncharacterized protein LOC116204471 [Punica granatum]PKI71651.1 hypothetical protein CRG98_007974 [Punica granatum]
MAISLGAFTALVAPETPSLAYSSASPYSLRLAVPARAAGRVAIVRAVTSAEASKPATGKRPPRGIMKPRRVTPEMQALVGVPEIPRTQALKHIWAHIKENNLQDPENKKIIICDEKLKKIFDGRDRVGFLEIAGLISRHFL